MRSTMAAEAPHGRAGASADPLAPPQRFRVRLAEHSPTASRSDPMRSGLSKPDSAGTNPSNADAKSASTGSGSTRIDSWLPRGSETGETLLATLGREEDDFPRGTS